MTSHQELPKTHRALVLSSKSLPPEVKTIPTPQPSPGCAIVRVEAANIISYSKYIYNGTRNYPMPTPLVIGTSGIGRVAALGPDAVLLKHEQLVWLDSYVRGRDDPGTAFLFGVHQGRLESDDQGGTAGIRGRVAAGYFRTEFPRHGQRHRHSRTSC